MNGAPVNTLNRLTGPTVESVAAQLGLPYLPTHHTPEQLSTFRATVAKLPRAMELPPRPNEYSTEAERLAYRVRSMVLVEQQMRAEEERMRTDPTEAAQRQRLAKMRIDHLGATIARLQQQRAALIERTRETP